MWQFKRTRPQSVSASDCTVSTGHNFFVPRAIGASAWQQSRVSRKVQGKLSRLKSKRTYPHRIRRRILFFLTKAGLNFWEKNLKMCDKSQNSKRWLIFAKIPIFTNFEMLTKRNFGQVHPILQFYSSFDSTECYLGTKYFYNQKGTAVNGWWVSIYGMVHCRYKKAKISIIKKWQNLNIDFPNFFKLS